MGTEAEDRFTLTDLSVMDAMVQRMGRVVLVAIDPPTAYLGGVDDHKNAELRSALLTPMKAWSARQNAGVIFNTHVNKPTGAKVEAMMRVMGSVAWVNGVRSAHMISKDPQNPARRLFIPMKNNIGEEKRGLAYQITKTDDLARLDWLDEVTITADEAINHERGQQRNKPASECLIEMFRMQREWPADLFWAHLKECGITRYAFDQARPRLAIPKSRRIINPHGEAMYTWWVPADWPYLFADEEKIDQRSANSHGNP
jgi:hypothetical protein